jgi:uncharacterized protein
MIRPRSAGTRMAATLLLGLTAGWLATAIHLPLPWMLGPLFAVAATGLAGWRPLAPPGARQAGQWAIGTALGLYFSPEVLRLLAGHAWLLLAAALASLAIGFLSARLTWRYGGVDPTTAFFSALPGGASEMATLAERWGGASDRIAAAHALRVLMVVSLVPMALTLSGAHGSDLYLPQARTVEPQLLVPLVTAGLAGVALFMFFRIANAWVLGPLAGVGLLTLSGAPLSALPGWLVNGGQLLIACSFGMRFSRRFFRGAPRFMASAALTTLLTLALSALVALALAASGIPLATLVLATAPGGVAEMCITAKVLQLGVPLVTACHILRLLVLTLAAPATYQVFLRSIERRTP